MVPEARTQWLNVHQQCIPELRPAECVLPLRPCAMAHATRTFSSRPLEPAFQAPLLQETPKITCSQAEGTNHLPLLEIPFNEQVLKNIFLSVLLQDSLP